MHRTNCFFMKAEVASTPPSVEEEVASSASNSAGNLAFQESGFESWANSEVTSRSRQQRNTQKLTTVALNRNQTKLTDFYNVFKDVQNLLEKDSAVNKDLQENVLKHSQEYFNVSLSTQSSTSFTTNESVGLLNILRQTAIKNSQVKLHGNRFEEPLKLFSLYIFIIGGRLMYETLYQNMKDSLPSIKTINKQMYKHQRGPP